MGKAMLAAMAVAAMSAACAGMTQREIKTEAPVYELRTAKSAAKMIDCTQGELINEHWALCAIPHFIPIDTQAGRDLLVNTGRGGGTLSVISAQDLPDGGSVTKIYFGGAKNVGCDFRGRYQRAIEHCG